MHGAVGDEQQCAQYEAAMWAALRQCWGGMSTTGKCALHQVLLEGDGCDNEAAEAEESRWRRQVQVECMQARPSPFMY